MSFRICGQKIDEQGTAAATEVPRCTFEKRTDAVSYLNMLTQVLRPDAGYEGEQDYWWVRNRDGVTRYTIRA